ncbi:MAG: MFS transporter [Desulfobacterales bacterium]
MTSRRKTIWGWAFYDWANSAFATTVMAGFFPIFFKTYWSQGVDVNISTARLGFGNAAAGLIVALMAPVLGAMADQGSRRKGFLLSFAYLGVLGTAGLYFIRQGQWQLATAMYVVGIIGFSGANIFYDALLPIVSGGSRMDMVSSLGYAMGYLGGGLLFLVNVAMTRYPAAFGLPDVESAIRTAFLSVAVWWGAFSLFTAFWVKEPEAGPRAAVSLRRGLARIFDTLANIRRRKAAFWFLLAYWCYIDGVDTVIRMAVDYGLSLGFDASALVIAILIVQFIGFPAAVLFGNLGERWGVRKALYLGIGAYMLITLGGTFMSRKEEFFALAAGIGLVQGGIQALSRSYFARLIPAERSGEFFGFYNMLGKFAAIVGPALVAVANLIAREMMMPADPTAEQLLAVSRLASRWGMASILILFAAGGALLFQVKAAEKRSDNGVNGDGNASPA